MFKHLPGRHDQQRHAGSEFLGYLQSVLEKAVGGPVTVSNQTFTDNKTGEIKQGIRVKTPQTIVGIRITDKSAILTEDLTGIPLAGNEDKMLPILDAVAEHTGTRAIVFIDRQVKLDELAKRGYATANTYFKEFHLPGYQDVIRHDMLNAAMARRPNMDRAVASRKIQELCNESLERWKIMPEIVPLADLDLPQIVYLRAYHMYFDINKMVVLKDF